MTDKEQHARALRSNYFCLLLAILESALNDVGVRRNVEALEDLRNFRTYYLFDLASAIGLPFPCSATIERNIANKLANPGRITYFEYNAYL